MCPRGTWGPPAFQNPRFSPSRPGKLRGHHTQQSQDKGSPSRSWCCWARTLAASDVPIMGTHAVQRWFL